MFDWITHTWNTVKGECPHACEYCYMKRWGPQKPMRLDEKEFNTNLGKGNTIFVGSSCDMWAEVVPSEWVFRTLSHCDKHFRNTYLFQSKHPDMFHAFENEMPLDSILGTTIESDLWYREMGKSPHPLSRFDAIWDLKESGFKTTITIEPIMFFDSQLAYWISEAKPDWVSIGANTNHKVKLKEPSAEKIKALITDLESFTTVKVKSNLARLTR